MREGTKTRLKINQRPSWGDKQGQHKQDRHEKLWRMNSSIKSSLAQNPPTPSFPITLTLNMDETPLYQQLLSHLRPMDIIKVVHFKICPLIQMEPENGKKSSLYYTVRFVIFLRLALCVFSVGLEFSVP